MRPAASMPDWFSRRYVCGPRNFIRVHEKRESGVRDCKNAIERDRVLANQETQCYSCCCAK